MVVHTVCGSVDHGCMANETFEELLRSEETSLRPEATNPKMLVILKRLVSTTIVRNFRCNLFENKYALNGLEKNLYFPYAITRIYS